MIDPNIVIIFLSMSFTAGVVNFLVLIFVYRYLRTALKTTDQDHSAFLRNELEMMITQHFDQSLKSLLPDDAKTQALLSQKYQSQLDKSLKQLQDTTQVLINEKVTAQEAMFTNHIKESSEKLNQLENSSHTAYQKAMEELQKEQVETFDLQVKELVKKTVGTIIQRELSVEDHTAIIKEQLNLAREYYER